MPKVCRMMKEDSGRPAVSSTGACLGVRVPKDIVQDEDGNVTPGNGGMSVSPTCQTLIERLSITMIPKRLRSNQRLMEALSDTARATLRGATGSNSLFVWTMGVGPFEAAPMGVDLQLRPDPTDGMHGFVEPHRTMHLDVYIGSLEASRDEWSKDEM